MTIIERLKMETKGFNYPDEELSVYLQENGLDPHAEYIPTSNANKKAIYATALALLESLANQPQLFKDYKFDDETVSGFGDRIQSRIDQLSRSLRMMSASDDSSSNGSTFMLFNS
ncbi:hypothetical protein PACILC2_52760 [Paenibacillus cisolokensis]|uniref:Uncharacterized protein n=1 Tax=Paenibacillus cisolokensis TaxID=1658519 RepID=A0ABQ4NFH0_9BACL|nr:hypothetical protein [Paenibacillus cisolokensis]GIQ66708.1 hypothetical protein PACILC2_52760 [Paenibacillus cisolokensis]